MSAQLLPHFYRLHDNGWVSVVSQTGNNQFTVTVARNSEVRPLRTATEVNAAQQLANALVPLPHSCSDKCTAWFEISDLSRQVEFTADCPQHHARSLSYTIGDILFRLHTLSFWCLQCGRSWAATDEQRSHLFTRLVRDLSWRNRHQSDWPGPDTSNAGAG
jgi:hypothetical protein